MGSRLFFNPYIFSLPSSYVTSNLVAYYDFANSTSYSGSGSTFTDLSGVGNNSVLTNPGTYISSVPKSMIWATNTVSNTVPLSTYNIPSTGITLEALVFVNSATATFKTIVSFAGATDTSVQLSLGVYNPKNIIYIWTGSANYPLSVPLTLNTWVHIAFTLGPSSSSFPYKFYVNGVPITNTTTPPNGGTTTNFATLGNTTSNRICIGDRNALGGFAGNVGMFRMYNKPLTSSEILQNYNVVYSSGNPYALPSPGYGWRAYIDAAASTDVGYAVAVDPQNNVYLVGGNGTVAANVYDSSLVSTLSVPINSAFIVKYDSVGNVLWRAYVDALSGADIGYSVSVDPNTLDVYLAGETSGTSVANIYNSNQTIFSNVVTVNNSFLVKYNKDGFGQWRTFIGSANDNKTYSVDADSLSNVYITGITGTAALPALLNADGTSSGLFVETQCAFLVKYSSIGNVLWRAYVDSATITPNVGRGIATQNDSSNVYLVGGCGAAVTNIYDSSLVSTLSVPINSAFIVQYSSTGAVNWRAYVDAASSTDIGYAVATDSQNNVYLVGGNGAVAANVYDSSLVSTLSVPINSAFIVKYNSVGNVLWRAYADVSGSTEIGYSVAVDSQNNVILTGTTGLNGPVQIFNSNVYSTSFANVYLSRQSAFMVKYDSTGKYIWSAEIDAQSGASADIGYGITFDKSDNVYITGNNNLAANIYNSSGIISQLALPASSAFLVKYNSSGNIDNQTLFKRWPPVDIAYENWAGTSPSFSNVVSGQLYGNGTYNITSTATSFAGYDARTLFDNTQTSNNSIAYYRTTTPAFVQIQFPSAVVINIYGIYGTMTFAVFTAWTFDGSNNGSTWTTLDTQTGQTAYQNSGGGWWSYVNNSTAYSYYRLNFTAPASGNLYLRNWRMYNIF